jgi:hypothetical protein
MSASFKILVPFVILCGATRSTSAEINLKQVRKQYLNAGAEDRLAIAKKMASIAKDVEPAVRILEEEVSDADERIRFEAISALRTIGPSAGHAVPNVILILQDQAQSNQLRLQCIRFLLSPALRMSLASGVA